MEPKAILHRESPAIVTIYSVDKSGKRTAFGSGFVLRPNGVVATNYHVIKGAYDAQVELKNGEIYENVIVLDYDVRHDVVALKIRAVSLPTVTVGDSSTVEAGDRAYAIGHPEGYDYSISDGLISAKRVMEGTEELQITVPISHGSSGGPLYNVYGQVIGMTTAGIMEGAQNINFAVPLKYVMVLLDSPPKNMTLAQLTDQLKPAEGEPKEEPKTTTNPEPTPAPAAPSANACVASGDSLEATPTAGWRCEDPPPKNMLISLVKGNDAAMLAFWVDARDADEAFERTRASVAKNYKRLTVYSDKGTFDSKDADQVAMRLQGFQGTKKGREEIVLVGSLQHGSRIIGVMGVCMNRPSYTEMLEIVKTFKW